MARLLLPIALLLLASCGGGGSTEPTPVTGWPAGTAVSVTCGRTGAPIAVPVLVDGAPYQGEAAPEASLVDVAAGGHIARQTLVRTGETALSLWPDDAGLPARYTKVLVYDDTDGSGATPLRRIAATSAAVVMSDALRGDARASRAHQDGVNIINAALAGRVVYQLDGAAGVTVTTRVDPADASCGGRRGATARTYWTGGALVKAELIYCSIDMARSATIIAHELGHTFGLRHSTTSEDLMHPVIANGIRGFSGRERLLMALMLQRRPENLWPDNDREAGTAARARLVVVDRD